MIRLVYWLLLAVKIVMVIDAVRRNAQLHWFLIIIFLPFGEFIYLFMVKLRRGAY